MLQVKWTCVLLLQFVIYVNSEGYYSIVAPGTIRPNSDYHVSVSTHNVQEPSVVKVSIKGPSFSDEKEIQIPPNSVKTIDFKLPFKLQEGDYNLIAKGISGIKFENEKYLRFKSKHKSIFIQTDKATYKPGDLVRFRVLVLDPNTRPTKFEDPVDVTITDPAENLIKQFKNVELTKGVFSGELQLSQFPVLGDWTIEVGSGDQKETKLFEIAKYVLPKFETVVEVSKHTLVDDKLRAIVRVKYTYGKPVKGDVTVTVKEKTNWSSSDEKVLTKTIPLDGKAYVEFDSKELYTQRVSTYGYITDFPREILVMASVKEKLTGNIMNASATTSLCREKYVIEEVDAPKSYVPNKPFNITVAVKNYDDTPVQDTKNSVKFTLVIRQEIPMSIPMPFHNIPNPSTSKIRHIDYTVNNKNQEFETKLDENGMATMEITPHVFEESYLIWANYLGKTYFRVIERKRVFDDDLGLEMITEKPKLNEDVTVKVMSKDPLKYFMYEVVGRGNILKTGRIDVPNDAKEYELKIKSTFEMVPRSSLYVYLVKDRTMVYETIDIEFENQFQNSIKIDTPAKAKPGEEVDISVSTDPDSYVGLLGVDQSVLLLKSGNDLSKDAIFNELGSYRTNKSHFYGFRSSSKNPSGLVMLSNANFPVDPPSYYIHTPGVVFSRMSSTNGSPIPTRGLPNTPIRLKDSSISVRKVFPETWIFDSIDDKNGEGKLSIRKKVPDTITSWVLTGFSINPKTGLGLTEEPRKFKVFRSFFVSTNLPYSVKRGEVINIPVSVFNYLDKNLDAEVTLDNSQKEFEFAEATNDIDEVLTEEVKRTKRATIKANSGESVSFLIRPKRVGHITLKISAITPIAGDAVEQILLVEPEGVTQYKNKAVFIDLTKQNEHKQDIEIEIPDNIVPDSVYSEISVVGDLLGPTIKNLDSLVRMPYGCGEQNMVNFVPNILVLKYLKNLNKLTPAIEEKAKKYLEVGYQRELTYKHPDGSYSAFGTSDKKGSTWLTAYVARSFRQAAKYIMIDEKVIKKALEFLANVQDENGCFPEVGDLIDFNMVADGKGIFLTAFTLMAFLENKEAFPEYDGTIKKGLNYLANNIDDKTNLYSLAVATYVLHLAGHEKKESILENLKSRAISKDNVKYWSEKPSSTKKKDNWYWDEPPTSEIETTSYALMALLEGGSSGDETVPILKWLVSKRNSLGGYYSTQATVVGLQAVIKFSERIGSTEKGDIEITFTDDKDSKGKIIINDENSLLLQTHVLSPDARSVSVTANGKGSTLAQISYRYNVNNVTEEPRFKLEAKVEDTKTPDILKMDVCTSFIPADNKKETNMVVMEVSLPTGYIADQDNLKALETIKNVKKIETKKGDTVVVINFDSLDSNEICSPIEGLRTHKVAKQKPASIVIYDYYDNTRQARIFYSPPNSSLCDVCEGDDCGSGCTAKA